MQVTRSDGVVNPPPVEAGDSSEDDDDEYDVLNEEAGKCEVILVFIR